MLPWMCSKNPFQWWDKGLNGRSECYSRRIRVPHFSHSLRQVGAWASPKNEKIKERGV
jgi:hypothetical protein